MTTSAQPRPPTTRYRLLIAALCLVTQTLTAQTDTAQVSGFLDQAAERLREIDSQAAACVTAEAESDDCRSFRQAIDGQPLADYLAHCASARRWRDDFITSTINADANSADQTDSAALLNLLVRFEYLCGEDALTRSTEHTLAAYRRVRAASGPGSGTFPPDDSYQQRLMDRERDRQQRELERQRERSRQQLIRQFDQLELELLRQQGM